MFDWLYFWNLIWSFFTLLSLVFVPVFMVMIYFITRAPRVRPGSSVRSIRSEAGAAPSVRENSQRRAA